MPVPQQGIGIDSLDLLREALLIERKQGVMRLVRRAADGVGHQHDPVAEIDGSQHGGEHAHIGFGAGEASVLNSMPKYHQGYQ